LLRTKILARIAAFVVNRRTMQRRAFRIVSQTGIRYRNSSLSKSLEQLPGSAPQAGDRFPWLRLKLTAGGPVEDMFQKASDLRFNLFLTESPAGEGLPEFADLVRTWRITKDAENDRELARVQIPAPSFYLVRPDGYVGLCGTSFDAATVKSYLL